MKSLKIFLLAFFCTVFVSAQNKQATIDDYLFSKFPSNEPGASVLIVKDGKIILKKGYGMANLEKKEAITPDMIFRIGSITKQFTSTAILKLAQSKKLDLQADITTYLPLFNTAGSKITVEQLLNHTSGIKSYTSLPDIMTKEGKAKTMSVEEMLQIVQKQPHDFAPGDQYLYNNSAYFMLGAIIEKVSGMHYEDYLIKNFFKPLKMNSTFVTDAGLPANATVGYQKTNATDFVVADYVHPSIPFSAGAIFSTVDDLWKWNQAVFSGKVVNKEWLDRAWSPTKLNNGTLSSYGYGWQLGRLGDKKVIGHGGGIDGFLSFEMYVPDQRLYVCILGNSSAVSPEAIAYEVAGMVADIKKEAPLAISLDTKKLDEYVGIYQVNPKEERIIRSKGNQLYSQRSGGALFEIYPYEEDAFVFKDSPTKAKFIRNGSGNVIAMELTAREWVIQRSAKTEKPLPTERVEIDIDPLSFDKFVGEYELTPGFTIKIWREDKAFKSQATGQQSLNIYPQSENEFFLKVVDAQLVFNKDDEGTVISLTLYQGGREIAGKKIN